MKLLQNSHTCHSISKYVWKELINIHRTGRGNRRKSRIYKQPIKEEE